MANDDLPCTDYANTDCCPLNNNINVNPGPPLPGPPGFGINIGWPMEPFTLDINLPDALADILRRLKFKMPGMSFLQAAIGDLQKAVSEIISQLLGYLNTFLGLYLFFLSFIELILCIINVLCGLPNPISLLMRMKKLFRKCIPIFITICLKKQVNLINSILTVFLKK